MAALKRILGIFIPLTLFIISVNGQAAVTIPKEFVETAPPKFGSDAWYALNYSHNEFEVAIVNGQLDIQKTHEVEQHTLEIADGTLVGTDHGEWGGKLTFNPRDANKNTVEIKSGNIKFIFNFQGRIYFIEGLAHLGINEGAIYRLDSANNQYSYAKLVDFDDAPQAFAIHGDRLLIATFEGFYVVEDFKKTPIFEDAFWSSLYPASIAVLDDKNVFMGIRGGIVKLDLANRTMKFYRYDK
ncbi:MAG: hypothetical protein LBE24_00645 [Methylobacillus sp.]|jgi:hypothetical protein|nr:hypothetical protein [Methylobacillus sp.]